MTKTAEAEQTELVPVTIEERIARQRKQLEREVDKAAERLAKAGEKAAAAEAALAEFDDDMAVIRGGTVG